MYMYTYMNNHMHSAQQATERERERKEERSSTCYQAYINLQLHVPQQLRNILGEQPQWLRKYTSSNNLISLENYTSEKD